MKRALAPLCLLATAWAFAGETSSDGSSSSGGSSSGGTSAGGTSTGGTSAGGTSAGGTSSGGTSTGGTSAAGGTSAEGGTAGTGAGPTGGGGGAIDAGGACQEGGTVDASTETVIAGSCVVAVVKVARIDEECSGAGGAHVTFDVIAIGKGSGVTKVQHGGHAYYAPPSGPDKLGEYFVAGIDPYGKLVPQPDNPGWCIVGLPPVDGWAHTFLEATGEADAKAKMQALLAK